MGLVLVDFDNTLDLGLKRLKARFPSYNPKDQVTYILTDEQLTCFSEPSFYKGEGYLNLALLPVLADYVKRGFHVRFISASPNKEVYKAKQTLLESYLKEFEKQFSIDLTHITPELVDMWGIENAEASPSEEFSRFNGSVSLRQFQNNVANANLVTFFTWLKGRYDGELVLIDDAPYRLESVLEVPFDEVVRVVYPYNTYLSADNFAFDVLVD